MKIACDADGVTCNLDGPWYARYNRDYNDTLTRDRIVSWDIHKYVKPECGMKIYDYLHDPTLYADVQPIDGALDGVERLRAAGHEVVFTTSCAWNMTDQKAEWFLRHGFTKKSRTSFLPDDFVPVNDKLLIDADMLIDDRGETVRRWVELKHKRALLFDYPHNRYLRNEVPSAFWQWCTPVRDWNEIVALIDHNFRHPAGGA